MWQTRVGDLPFERINGIPCLITTDERSTVPFTLVTEFPDETVRGAAFRLAHTTQMRNLAGRRTSLLEGLVGGMSVGAGQLAVGCDLLADGQRRTSDIRSASFVAPKMLSKAFHREKHASSVALHFERELRCSAARACPKARSRPWTPRQRRSVAPPGGASSGERCPAWTPWSGLAQRRLNGRWQDTPLGAHGPVDLLDMVDMVDMSPELGYAVPYVILICTSCHRKIAGGCAQRTAQDRQFAAAADG